MNQRPASTSTSSITIADCSIGPGQRCFIVAEIAQAHDGSLGAAHAYIDAVARAGADAVKFQTHIAAAESTRGEPFRVRFSPQDASRYDYWRRMEFTEEQWVGLARHAAELKLAFLSSPFSMEAIDLLERVGVPAWKVGAGEIINLPLLERLTSTGKPVLLSSGMAEWQELDAAVELLRRAGAPVAVYQCTSMYPCPPERLGLNVLHELRERYSCPVGLSDHSGTIWAGVAARVFGADLVEVHTTFSRECFGPDVASSVTTSELAELVRGIRFVDRALTNPVDKSVLPEDLGQTKLLFGRSAVAARPLPAGHRVQLEDVTLKKPAGGVPPARVHEIVGRVICHEVPADHRFEEADFV